MVTWSRIWQLWMLLSSLLRWQATLDCEMLSLPDTALILLTGFASIVWNMASESMLLSLPDFAWSLMFLQPEWNFLNNLLTVLWSAVPSPFAQQIFLLISAGLRLSSNSKNISSQIRLHCMFIPETLKSHKECNNARHVSTPITTMLPTTTRTCLSLNCFGYGICIPQTSICQNIAKFSLTRVTLKLMHQL